MKLEEINNISRLVVFVFCIVDALSACEGRQRFFLTTIILFPFQTSLLLAV